MPLPHVAAGIDASCALLGTELYGVLANGRIGRPVELAALPPVAELGGDCKTCNEGPSHL